MDELTATADNVSIVIPNYNGADLLPDTLAALSAQSVGGFEVLVVDNGSADSSVAWLRALDAGPRVLVLPKNRGFAGGANAGVAAVQRPLVAVLNSDARPDPDWLRNLLSEVARSPGDVWAWGSVLIAATGLVESAGDAWRGTSAYKLLRGCSVAELPTSTYEVFAPPGAAPLFRRDTFVELGGYDEQFFLYYEDVDLAWRARLQGFRAVLVPTAQVVHLGGVSSRDREARAWFHIARNSLWCAVRCPPHVHPRALLRASRREFRTARERGVASAYLRGRAAGVLGLGRQLRRRRTLQAGRTVDVASLQSFLSRQQQCLDGAR